MKLSRSSFGLFFGAARPALLASSLAAVAVSAYAQTPPVTPHSLIEYSTITSSGDTINASRVPARDANGVIHYWDVSLVFDTDAEGNLTLASGYPTFVPSPVLITSHFKAGKYVAPSGATIVVSGPGIASGGATEWSLVQSGTTCAFPYSATWYVGSITSNPLYARLKADGITSTAYSYGLLGTYGGCGGNIYWGGGALLGFAQTADSLTIVSFSYENSDSGTPLAQITYTYEP